MHKMYVLRLYRILIAVVFLDGWNIWTRLASCRQWTCPSWLRRSGRRACWTSITPWCCMGVWWSARRPLGTLGTTSSTTSLISYRMKWCPSQRWNTISSGTIYSKVYVCKYVCSITIWFKYNNDGPGHLSSYYLKLLWPRFEVHVCMYVCMYVCMKVYVCTRFIGICVCLWPWHISLSVLCIDLKGSDVSAVLAVYDRSAQPSVPRPRPRTQGLPLQLLH